jgi:hypothetical protein
MATNNQNKPTPQKNNQNNLKNEPQRQEGVGQKSPAKNPERPMEDRNEKRGNR